MIEKINLIKVATVTCGDARISGRAPSHDGEYLTVIKLADDCWLATGNGGVACGSEEEWFDGDDRYPGFDELALAAENATENWDFIATPEKYGFEARDTVLCWLEPAI